MCQGMHVEVGPSFPKLIISFHVVGPGWNSGQKASHMLSHLASVFIPIFLETRSLFLFATSQTELSRVLLSLPPILQ